MARTDPALRDGYGTCSASWNSALRLLVTTAPLPALQRGIWRTLCIRPAANPNFPHRRASVPATAALAAPGKIVLFRHATEFHRLHDIAADGLMDPLHLLLGFQESADHTICMMVSRSCSKASISSRVN